MAGHDEDNLQIRLRQKKFEFPNPRETAARAQHSGSFAAA
jgi:hypothetical protein